MHHTTNPQDDFDGCRRACRLGGAHTLVRGECEHAAEPEPAVSLSRVYTDTDGLRSIGFDTYTVPELARLIEPVLGDPLMAAAAARRIVHRHDEQPAVSPSAVVSADRATLLREAADADALVADARRAVHEALIYLAAPEADRVRALIADLETAVESRTAIRMADGPSRVAAEEQPAETQAVDLAAALDGLHTLIATSSRDWQTYRVDAWIWAVLCGWDCEQAEHDETCTHGALEETAAMHGWDADTVAKARRYRAAVRAVVEAQQPDTQTREADRIVAYVPTTRTELHCLRCAPNPAGDIWTPVTAEELDDGGICTVCGRDVLITEETDCG